VSAETFDFGGWIDSVIRPERIDTSGEWLIVWRVGQKMMIPISFGYRTRVQAEYAMEKYQRLLAYTVHDYLRHTDATRAARLQIPIQLADQRKFPQVRVEHERRFELLQELELVRTGEN
jgi:hypothetical protein